MKNDKELINLEQLKTVREVAVKMNNDINIAEKVKQDLVFKLSNIHHNCTHDLVVRYKDNQVGRIACCLCCTKIFYGPIVGLDLCFKNIIDLPDTMQDEDVTEYALKLFEQERAKHPKLSDARIVEIINSQIKHQTTSVEESGFVKSIGTK